MRIFTTPLFLFVIVPLFGGEALLHVERSAPAMGATFSMEMYGRKTVVMQAAAEKALAEAARIDRMLSNYQPDSELSKVNKYAAEAPVKVSQELFDLLTACLAYSRASEG